jgi:hypothetical protein
MLIYIIKKKKKKKLRGNKPNQQNGTNTRTNNSLHFLTTATSITIGKSGERWEQQWVKRLGPAKTTLLPKMLSQ